MAKEVAIFAGHYDDLFEETGSKGIRTRLEPDGVYEEFDTNIVIAREAVRLLRKVDGLKVHFPQEHGADYRSLGSRVRYCNDHDVDLALFIHSNAGPSTAKGACAFYYYTNGETKKLAQYYRSEMKRNGYPLWSNGTYGCNPNDGWSFFYVIRYTKMNALLTENFFFTNPYELREYLQDGTDLKKLGLIHARTACHELHLDMPSDKPVVKSLGSVKGKQLRVIYNEPNDAVNYYTSPNWKAQPAGQYSVDVVREITAKYSVDGADMYEFEYKGKKYYITAASKFVKEETIEKEPTYQSAVQKPTQEEINMDKTGFKDVSEKDYFADAVKFLAAEGILSGYGNNEFGSDDVLKRKDFAVALYRYDQKEEDVSYKKAIEWIKDQELMTGYSNGEFGEEDPVKRKDFAVVIYRYAQKMK